MDDADALVVGVREVLAACEAERFLVPLEGLVVLVCNGGRFAPWLAIAKAVDRNRRQMFVLARWHMCW